jgi:hypothetical protein
LLYENEGVSVFDPFAEVTVPDCIQEKKMFETSPKSMRGLFMRIFRMLTSSLVLSTLLVSTPVWSQNLTFPKAIFDIIDGAMNENKAKTEPRPPETPSGAIETRQEKKAAELPPPKASSDALEAKNENKTKAEPRLPKGNFDNLPAKTFCLKDICLGDSLDSLPAAFRQNIKDYSDGYFSPKPLPILACGVTGSIFYDHTGEKVTNPNGTLGVAVLNDQTFLDQGVGKYYRVSRISYSVSGSFRPEDVRATVRELVKRMKFTRQLVNGDDLILKLTAHGGEHFDAVFLRELDEIMVVTLTAKSVLEDDNQYLGLELNLFPNHMINTYRNWQKMKELLSREQPGCTASKPTGL